METQKNIQANILIQIDNVWMHRLVSKQRSLYTSGVCKIAKIENAHESPVYFMNINSFYYTLSKSVRFTKIQYDDTVSYIFSHFDSGLSSVTLAKNDEIIHNFDEILRNVAELNQFNIAIRDEEFQKIVNEHCPNIEKESIFSPDKIKSTILLVGKKVQGGLRVAGDYVSSGIHKAGQFIENKVDQPSNKAEVSPVIKQKWQTLKQGTNNILHISMQIYKKYLSSWVQTGFQYGKQLTKKIESSQNSTIKYATSLAYTSGNAICHAFKGLSDGTNKIVNQLGMQSRKIVKKRFGDDYVKTFLPQCCDKENCTQSMITKATSEERTPLVEENKEKSD